MFFFVYFTLALSGMEGEWHVPVPLFPFESNPKWETDPAKQRELLVSLVETCSELKEVARLMDAAHAEGDRIKERRLIRRANEIKLLRSEADYQWYEIPASEREAIIYRNLIGPVLPLADFLPRLFWR